MTAGLASRSAPAENVHQMAGKTLDAGQTQMRRSVDRPGERDHAGRPAATPVRCCPTSRSIRLSGLPDARRRAGEHSRQSPRCRDDHEVRAETIERAESPAPSSVTTGEETRIAFARLPPGLGLAELGAANADRPSRDLAAGDLGRFVGLGVRPEADAARPALPPFVRYWPRAGRDRSGRRVQPPATARNADEVRVVHRDRASPSFSIRTGQPLHLDRLDALGDRAGGEVARRVRSYVDGLDTGARSDLRGGRDRLAILAEGELGRRLDPALGDGEEIDLRRALDRREVVYFRVDADRYPLAARLLGAALVIDLASLAAGRQGDPTAAVVLMDEFGSLAAAQVSRLLARCRGAGISLVLGTQSLADLRAVGSGEDTLTEQVIANVGYTIAHRIADPDSAERLARMAGTEPDWTKTEQLGPGFFSASPGMATRTRERDFVVGPDAFKRLPPGRAVVINPTRKPPAEIVQIWPPELVTAVVA